MRHLSTFENMDMILSVVVWMCSLAAGYCAGSAKPAGNSKPGMHEPKAVSKASVVWGYGPKNGPDWWGKNFVECVGVKQSPIDIDLTRVVYDPKLSPIKMSNYRTRMGFAPNVTNTGRTVSLNLEPFGYMIRGGYLAGEFKAHHMVFHWGSTDATGSEHLINRTVYPLELQIFHHNTLFKGGYKEAVDEDGGIAALSFLFKISKKDNPTYTQLIAALESIVNPGKSVQMNGTFTLSDMLPNDLYHYYRYYGSMTTPPCQEVVYWSVFADPIDISVKQLAKFRLLAGPGNKPQPPNFRPIQKVHKRTIYTSERDEDTSEGTITTKHIIAFVISVVVMFGVGYALAFRPRQEVEYQRRRSIAVMPKVHFKDM